MDLSEKHIKFLASNVNTKWQDLGLELSLDEDILNAICKDSADPVQQCHSMLQHWRASCRPGINQIDKIRKALQRIDVGDDVDIVIEGTCDIPSIVGRQQDRISLSDKSYLGNAVFNPVANVMNVINVQTQPVSEEETTNLTEKQVEMQGMKLRFDIIDALQTKYEFETFMSITPHQCASPRRINLDELYTDAVVVQYPRDGNENKAKPITVDEIGLPFNRRRSQATAFSEKHITGGKPDLQFSKRILIQGQLGCGKTTLMKKIAHSWTKCDGKSLFMKYIVVYVELNKMNRPLQQQEDFVNHVIHRVLPTDFHEKHDITRDMLRKFIIKNDDMFVFLCDGYNELLSNECCYGLKSVFAGESLQKSIVLITARPGNLEELTKCCDCHIKIIGFSTDHQSEYVKKFFKDEPEKAEQFMVQRSLLDPINEIVGETPLFLFYLCTLWKVNQRIPTKVIELYRDLMVCRANQTIGNISGLCSRRKKVNSFSDIDESFRNAMLYIGKCVLKCLFENRFRINENELYDEQLTASCIKYGMLNEKASQSDVCHQVSFVTMHASESEFLAGFYVADAIKSGKDDIKQTIISMLSNANMIQVCKFTIALLGKDACRFMDYFHLKHLNCSFLSALLDECPEDEARNVYGSISLRMDQVCSITISDLAGLSVCKKINNFKNTCELNIFSSHMLDSRDANIILHNIPTLKIFSLNDLYDESFEKFILTFPLPSDLEEVRFTGEIQSKDACNNLAMFLYNTQSLKCLKLPVIGYGPGLLRFVSILYGHEQCCVGSNKHIEPVRYKHMNHVTFTLKMTYAHEHRNNGYAFLISRFIALCPYLKSTDIYESNQQFRKTLFRKLVDLHVFREYIAHQSLSDTSMCIAGILQTPSTDMKFMVTAFFLAPSDSHMTIIVEVNDIGLGATLKVECPQLLWLATPFQIMSQSTCKPRNDLYLSWHNNLQFDPSTREVPVDALISSLCYKRKLKSLSLPCEALTLNMLSIGKTPLKVSDLTFTLNNMVTDPLEINSLLEGIGMILSRFSFVSSVTIPPFEHVVTLLSEKNLKLQTAEILTRLNISIGDPLTDVHACNVLAKTIANMPDPWSNHMDIDSDGTLSFTLPNMRSYKKNTVRCTRHKLQRLMNVMKLGLKVYLYGFPPCRIRQFLDFLRKLNGILRLKRAFVHPCIMFGNPYAVTILSGFTEINILKVVAFPLQSDSEQRKNFFCHTEKITITNNTIEGTVKMNAPEFVALVKSTASSNALLPSWNMLLSLSKHLPLNNCLKKSQVISNFQQHYRFKEIVDILRSCIKLKEIDFRKCFSTSDDYNSFLSCVKNTGLNLQNLNSINFSCSASIHTSVFFLLRCFKSVSKLSMRNFKLKCEQICDLSAGCNLTELVVQCKFDSGIVIGEAFMNLPKLRVFDASMCVIDGSTYMNFVGHVVSHQEFVHCHLEVMKFSKFRIKCKYDSSKIGAMHGQFIFQLHKLKWIDVSRFKMGTFFLTPFLVSMMQQKEAHYGLNFLDISGHRFNIGDMSNLANALLRLPNLSAISLAMCKIPTYVCEFFGCRTQICKLNLSGSQFKFNSQHINLVECFVKYSPEDSVGLNLSRPMPESNAYELHRDLFRKLHSGCAGANLRVLNLSRNMYLRCCMRDLAVCIPFLPSLKVLLMRRSELTGDHLQTFVCVLRDEGSRHSLPRLTEIDMSYTRFRNRKVGGNLVSLLEIFPTLEILRLVTCAIRLAIIYNFVDNLEKMEEKPQELKSLILYNNPICDYEIYSTGIWKYLPLSCDIVFISDGERVIQEKKLQRRIRIRSAMQQLESVNIDVLSLSQMRNMIAQLVYNHY
ncbi:uncharacterized protein LOC117111852 [Anneissia japonica]|uniref:uncharacterized protein LOC117111852 n=1 Tax=Anneissia japonica TaxID=1529436 RepID=UPI001425B002|nr:uncharacterized protein LOC117111852 [Anneissia japonica]